MSVFRYSVSCVSLARPTHQLHSILSSQLSDFSKSRIQFSMYRSAVLRFSSRPIYLSYSASNPGKRKPAQDIEPPYILWKEKYSLPQKYTGIAVHILFLTTPIIYIFSSVSNASLIPPCICQKPRLGLL